MNKHSWVEININGKWILSDPVYALRYQNLDIVNQNSIPTILD